LLRDGGLQVPVVVVISWEVLQVGFELLVFCETGPVVTVIRRNRDEVLAQDDALHPDRVWEQALDGCLPRPSR